MGELLITPEDIESVAVEYLGDDYMGYLPSPFSQFWRDIRERETKECQLAYLKEFVKLIPIRYKKGDRHES